MRHLLAWLLGAYFGTWALAGQPPPLALSREGVYPLAGHMMAMETPVGIPLAEVQQAYIASRFRTIPGDYLGGYRVNEVWLTFDIQTPDHESNLDAWLEVTPASLEEISLFLPLPGGGLRELRGGAGLPYSVRPLRHRDVVFPIAGRSLKMPSIATCFLRVRSRTPLVVQPVIRTGRTFSEHVEIEAMLFGGMFGTGILVLLWNLLYWLKLRDPLQLKYAGYLISMLVMLAGLEGYLGLLLFPERPDLVTLISRLGVSTQPWLAISLFCALFDLQNVLPRFDRIYRRVAVGFTCLAVAFTMAGRYFDIAAPLNAVLLGCTVLNLALALTLGLRKKHDAWSYLLAFGPYLVGVIAHIGRNMNLLQAGFLGEHGLHLGAFVHFCLMNLPLAQRHARLQEERDQATAKALDLSIRNERELEGMVEERTRELRVEQARTSLALTRERQAATEQREFFSIVSHEFRTPLAIIDGSAQLVELNAERSPEEVQRLASTIRRGARRMVDLFDMWLTKDRIASGLTTPTPELVDLDPFLAEIVQHAKEMSANHDVTSSIEGPRTFLEFDKELVRAALRNLVENAIKYSPQGGSVLIKGHSQGDRYCLSVIDQGLGIPEDQLERTTSRFFRGRNTQHIPGVGLGLYLVRRVAELHGGTFELESTEGAGTAAKLLLPLATKIPSAQVGTD